MPWVKMYGRYDTQPCETITGMQTKKKCLAVHTKQALLYFSRQQTHQQILVSLRSLGELTVIFMTI